MSGSDIRDLDLQGLKCPLPVLHTRRAMAQLPVGALLRVRCTDPMSAIDIPHMAHEHGDTLLSQEHEGGVLVFVLLRGGAAGAHEG